MPFELVLEGRTYSTDDLTIAEAVALEKELGRTWRELNPLASAEEFQAFATACLSRDHPADQAAKIVAGLPLSVALTAASWVTDGDLPDTYEDGHPKAEVEPSTTTSSGSPDLPTDGPPT